MGARGHKEAIKARAAALGFHACGVAAAGPVEEIARLDDWLTAGCHADMEWIARTKALRHDPSAQLPGARSVIAVAANYFAPRSAGPDGPGRVSRYAWGRDYHRALFKPLRSLARFIEEQVPETACYCSIDTGPVLERYWAAQAGLGWIGKNCLLIHPDLGSWVFLAIILTTALLEPDAPIEDGCGSCRRCIEACPSGALAAPRRMDARRCIAYHTVENRGDIPPDIQMAMGNWVFGCDVCQEACPKNDTAQTTDMTDFHPRPGHAVVDEGALEMMTETSFNDRFAGSPIRRATLNGMRRNARIAARNWARKQSTP